MFSLKSIVRAFSHGTPAALNDNDAVALGSCADERRRRDPYLRDAAEARRLIGSARLISAVDGSSSAVLNVMATRGRPAA